MPKYKVGDKLSADYTTVINIIAITPRNYVVEYIKGMNIGQESLWDILGLDGNRCWLPYKEPRKTETRFVGVLENSNGDILTSPSTWRNRYSLERSYKHAAYKLIDIIEINYEEKS